MVDFYPKKFYNHFEVLLKEFRSISIRNNIFNLICVDNFDLNFRENYS